MIKSIQYDCKEITLRKRTLSKMSIIDEHTLIALAKIQSAVARYEIIPIDRIILKLNIDKRRYEYAIDAKGDHIRYEKELIDPLDKTEHIFLKEFNKEHWKYIDTPYKYIDFANQPNTPVRGHYLWQELSNFIVNKIIFLQHPGTVIPDQDRYSLDNDRIDFLSNVIRTVDGRSAYKYRIVPEEKEYYSGYGDKQKTLDQIYVLAHTLLWAHEYKCTLIFDNPKSWFNDCSILSRLISFIKWHTKIQLFVFNKKN